MEDSKYYAICVLKNPEEGIEGVVKFIETSQVTKIIAEIKGLKPGKHGFHVHEFGNLTQGCKTAGGHYNPFAKNHGGPAEEERHVGDLGNIVAGEDGVGYFELEDKQIRLSGDYSIVGRSVVVHADEDDLGKGGFEDSLTTGHAGARVVCGVIGSSAKF